MSYFKPVTVSGSAVDLAHLQPFTMLIDSKKAKRVLRVHVTFSTHCFSVAYVKATHPAGDTVIDQDSPRPRTFCPIRYQLSFALPQLIQSLNNAKASVFQCSKRRNWAFTVLIESPQGPYHVFLEIRRANATQRQWQDLNLRVESAYHETTSGPDVLGSMGFVLLCGKTYLGEPVATKR